VRRVVLDARGTLLVSAHLSAADLFRPPRACLRLQTDAFPGLCLEFADHHALHLVAHALSAMDRDCRAALRARRPRPLSLLPPR
jgi:hypothetical protein